MAARSEGGLSPGLVHGFWPLTLEPEGAGEGSGSSLAVQAMLDVHQIQIQAAVPSWSELLAAFDELVGLCCD